MIPFGHNLIVAKQETCEKRKELCMAMGQSIKDATAFIQTKPDEAFAILKKRFPTLDDNLLKASFEELKKVEMLDERDQQREKAEENAREQTELDRIATLRFNAGGAPA